MCFHVFSRTTISLSFLKKKLLGKCLLGSENNSLGGLRITLIVKCYIKGQFINDEWLINGFQVD